MTMRILISLCLAFMLFTAGEAQAGGKPVIKLTTTMGDIVLELNPEKAPITSANFEQYVKDGFYDGLIFHRVIDGFMIQGGGFDADMNQKETRQPIQNEADNGLANDKYTIAMARTQDPHSATGQFFINVKDNDFLNFRAPTLSGWGYAVFGKVVKGQDVVDAIAKVETGSRGYFDDVPKTAVVITKAEIVSE
ncbi:peptidyl-prolyl cis-trans isomerase [Taurinivorans muris]|uniref:Peptidyl-prolyl cis-trans isomerase n=2 Tax=Taurinivorans muris TaxID=2787751 RepID=A0ABY5XZK7_9BACT|nr:peptidyl-prolyl cis-trans isomerase [Desulfovibrionaceae bacterium LT0009]